MPELPEVETIRRDLQYAILGKGIRKVDLHTGRCLGSDQKEFVKTLEGNRFERIDRRGKLLQFTLAYGDKTMLVHLKMTGQLLCEIPGGLIVGGHPMAKIDDLPNKYTHISFHLADGTILHFNDVRTFGYIKLVDETGLKETLSKFGLEPLHPDFTKEKFAALFQKRKTNLKAFLLNQQLIAGIGNIYADEICYRAKVRPDRPVNSLSKSEINRLHTATAAILDQAVKKRGTTFSNYVDASGKKGGYYSKLKVYNREGERCHRCGDDYIEKMIVAGRGTHYCGNCQK
jgi:formamidopyrimidine-DNA glycosylase